MSATFRQHVKVLAADGAEGDEFGLSVSLSGDTLVVGANGHHVGNEETGVAYVFERHADGADGWGQVAVLNADDGQDLDRFGAAVAVDGDTIIIGAYNTDEGGSAYIFERDPREPEVWRQTADLTPPDVAVGDRYGFAVAIDAGTAIVGSYFDDDLGASSGSARVFMRDAGLPNGWGLVAKLLAHDGAIGDRFGRSVAISEDTIVVGSMLDDDLGDRSGSAYVFERDAGGPDAWGQVAKLTAPDGGVDDEFGEAVAIDGDTLVVGAHSIDKTGFAYVFERDPALPYRWNTSAKLVAPDGALGDRFGGTVSIAAETVLVGAPLHDDLGESSGAAYAFSRDPGGPGGWEVIREFTAPDGVAFDQFGISVSIDGPTWVVGSWGDADLGAWSGSAHVFWEAPCELRLTVEETAVRAGGALRFTIELTHSRLELAAVPLRYRVVDSNGQLVATSEGPARRLRFGDRLEGTRSWRVPSDLPAGDYELQVGIEEMQQGVAWASERFQVVETTSHRR